MEKSKKMGEIVSRCIVDDIVAGLYGITLTGYIFFLEHLQQLKKENEALQSIVDALKQRYHTMVKVISIYVVAEKVKKEIVNK